VGADRARLGGRQPHDRIPGADCNPYLAFAAALASGLDGIANRTEPPPPTQGSGYADSERGLPGADCNPYLAYTAALASGLDGIANQIEPPPAFDGDAYRAEGVAPLPATLAEATDRFEASEFARTALGDEVVDHYAHFFRVEQEAFEHAVTDWERRRYFERI